MKRNRSDSGDAGEREHGLAAAPRPIYYKTYYDDYVSLHSNDPALLKDEIPPPYRRFFHMMFVPVRITTTHGVVYNNITYTQTGALKYLNTCTHTHTPTIYIIYTVLYKLIR